MAAANNDVFGGDGSGGLANGGQVIEIYHVPTKFSVKFKAMMTQFEDAYTCEWNSEAVYGRMDPIQTYQRTGRVISVAFSVAASDMKEAKTNLERISTLVQFLYPTYEANGIIKNSPYCKIQFMNWSAHGGISGNAKQVGLLGTIGGFTFVPDLEPGVFSEPSGNELYPKLINVAFQFTVIHAHPLGWRNKTPSAAGMFPYGVFIDNITSKNSSESMEFEEAKSAEQVAAIPAIEEQQRATQEILSGGPSGFGPLPKLNMGQIIQHEIREANKVKAERTSRNKAYKDRTGKDCNAWYGSPGKMVCKD